MNYTRETFAGQVQRWLDAADAYRHRDAPRIADLFFPGGRPDRVAYPDAITITTLGACLCASELAKLNRHALGVLPDGHRYILENLHPQREPTAGQRVAAQAITTAANGDFTAVAEQIAGYLTYDVAGAERFTDVIMDLLATYVAITAAVPP